MSSSPAVVAEPQRVDPAAMTAEFCEALFGWAPENLNSLLWTLQDKRSTWVPLDAPGGGPAAVAQNARRLVDSGKDVYVAVSLAERAGLPDTRIKSANAAGIMGLWADIDIAAPDVHKKWNLPPTVEAAMELLHKAQAQPSVIVHSGHGLQAWWLFKEFWEFDTEEQRLEAAGLAQRWNNTLQYQAALQNWVVDSTFDLARLMRMPGTLNRKGSPVMPVRLLSSDGPRWTADELEPFVKDKSVLRGMSPARKYQVGELNLSEANEPPGEKFTALRDNDSRFEQTWRHARKDFTDQSPSSYDMSLANQAAAAGWTDDEIAALIRAFRRAHKLDVAKALRPDYMKRTIGMARDLLAREAATEQLEELGEALDEAKASGDDEAERYSRRSALDAVGHLLAFEVLHFIKYLSDPPAYAAVTPTVTIPLGSADAFLTWAKFRQAVTEYADVLIDRFKPVEWDRVCRLLLKAIEDQDVGAEATDSGEMAAWLSQYLSQRPAVDTLEEAKSSEYPYLDGGRVVMFGPAFKRWLYLSFQERVTNKELGRRLRSFGAEPDKINIETPDGKRTSRGVWRLPQGVGT